MIMHNTKKYLLYPFFNFGHKHSFKKILRYPVMVKYLVLDHVCVAKGETVIDGCFLYYCA